MINISLVCSIDTIGGMFLLVAKLEIVCEEISI